MGIFQDLLSLEEKNLSNPQPFANEVIEYFYSYQWLKHKRSIEKVEYYISCGLSYHAFCEHFGVTYDAATVSISYAAKKLKEKLGNTLQLLAQNKPDEAQAEFYFLTGRLTLADYITAPALSLIPPAKYKTVRLEDCLTELEYLRLYSKAELNRIEGFIDKDNLAYLRFILEGSNPKLSDTRLLLMKLLQGELSAEEVIEQ